MDYEYLKSNTCFKDSQHPINSIFEFSLILGSDLRTKVSQVKVNTPLFIKHNYLGYPIYTN